MPILFPRLKIAFFDTPKVASTTVKVALHELETGEDAGPKPQIHQMYPTHRLPGPEAVEVPDGYWSFAIVRDPVQRLMSAYSNRVLHHRDTRKGRLPRLRSRLLNVSLEPSADEFFLKIGRYRLQSRALRHHVEPMQSFVGRDLSHLDAVYRIDELDRLRADIEARVGRPVTFKRLQTGGPKLSADILSPRAHAALLRYAAPEYELLKDYYAPPPPRE